MSHFGYYYNLANFILLSMIQQTSIYILYFSHYFLLSISGYLLQINQAIRLGYVILLTYVIRKNIVNTLTFVSCASLTSDVFVPAYIIISSGLHPAKQCYNKNRLRHTCDSRVSLFRACIHTGTVNHFESIFTT